MFRFFNVLGAVVALGAAMIFATAPASAQDLNVVTPEDMATVLDGLGMDVQFESLSDAEGPVLSSEASGFQFLVSFEACDDDGEECELIVFRCGLAMAPEDQPDLELLNVWNDTRWGKATMDEEGDPWIVLEINTVGGLTEDNLTDTIQWWTTLMDEFADFVGFEK